MTRKKTKFVSINTPQAPIFPGRQRCDCQAIKHDLINNCLGCGRIVCVQEGAGPCMYCGDIVLPKEERIKMAFGNTKEAQKLIAKYSKMEEEHRKLTETNQKEAMATKQRLLEYDKTSARRTKVIDDQSDYFATQNPWLSEEEKTLITQKRNAYEEAKSRLKRKTKITIDFAGRRIVEEQPPSASTLIKDFADLNVGPKKDDTMKEDTTSNTPKMQPQFVGALTKADSQVPILWSNRIQDPELQEMVDAGNCLSILQPFASFIVEGIKKFEGRTWYTPVKGRLWICSGSKVPTAEMTEQAEKAYQLIVPDVIFPPNYPTGALLGCVNLVDCIPQETYLELYPNGEVSDPYVLVLANPQRLSRPIPIQGKSKIFKIENHILQAAKKTLISI